MARLGLVGRCFPADKFSVHCRHMYMTWRLKGHQWQELSCRAAP